MKLFDLIKTFKADEDGAVTVDWVVLTAAIVGLGMAVMLSVRTGATDLAGRIGTELKNMEVVVDQPATDGTATDGTATDGTATDGTGSN